MHAHVRVASHSAQAIADLDWQPEFGLLDGLRDSYEKDFGRGTYRKEPDFTPGEDPQQATSHACRNAARLCGGGVGMRGGPRADRQTMAPRCECLQATHSQRPFLLPRCLADDMILERVKGKASALA